MSSSSASSMGGGRVSSSRVDDSLGVVELSGVSLQEARTAHDIHKIRANDRHKNFNFIMSSFHKYIYCNILTQKRQFVNIRGERLNKSYIIIYLLFAM